MVAQEFDIFSIASIALASDEPPNNTSDDTKQFLDITTLLANTDEEEDILMIPIPTDSDDDD